ncbi:MAG: hypothetical protein ACREAW_03155, partial [Nitrososphaera sp.]
SSTQKMFESLLTQIGFPADVCYQYFFGALENCKPLISRDSNLYSALVLVSDIAVLSGIGAAAYFFVRRIRRSHSDVQTTN